MGRLAGTAARQPQHALTLKEDAINSKAFLRSTRPAAWRHSARRAAAARAPTPPAPPGCFLEMIEEMACVRSAYHL